MVDVSAVTSSGLWERVLDDADRLTWVVAGQKEGAKNVAVIDGSGEGGIEEITAVLKDDKVQFGAFRVTAIDVKGGVTSTRGKLVGFVWVGENVKAMNKMARNNLQPKVMPYFQGIHITVELLDGDQLNEEDVKTELLAAGGAHKPHSFHFGFYDQGAKHRKQVLTHNPSNRSSGSDSPAAAAAPAPAADASAAEAKAEAAAAEAEAEAAAAAEKAAAEKAAAEKAAAEKAAAEKAAAAAAEAEAAAAAAEAEAAAAAAEEAAPAEEAAAADADAAAAEAEAATADADAAAAEAEAATADAAEA